MLKKILAMFVASAVLFTNTGICTYASENAVRDAETETVVETEPVETETAVETEPVETETAVETEPVETETIVETEPVETETIVETEPVETETAVETEPVETETAVETEPVETETVVETELVETETIIETETAETVSETEEVLEVQQTSDFSYTENEDGTLTVTGYVGATQGDLIIPGEIDGKIVTAIGNKAFINRRFDGTLVIPDSIERIGEEAFCRCYYLKGPLVLPESITSIGNSAFEYCTFLEGELVLPKELTTIGNSVFEACGNLTGELVIPQNVVSIGESAFEGCRGLTGGLVIPDSVSVIGKGAFKGCSQLNGELVLSENLNFIGEYAFWTCGFTGSLTIPTGITSIEQYAFAECDFNGTLYIPESVEKIGYMAFAGCSGLTGNLVLPEGLVRMDSYGFSGCSGFTGDLNIPAGITTIARGAFENCSGFNGTLSLPEELTKIEPDAFSGCSGLTGELLIPQGVEYIDFMAFQNCSGFTGELVLPDKIGLGQNAFENCSGFSGDLRIPEGASLGPAAFKGCTGFNGDLFLSKRTYISNEAFKNCTGFQGTLTIMEGITRIGARAFENCAGFVGTVVIPEGVTHIDDAAFNGCDGISRVDIPHSVKYISQKAFGKMDSLTEVYYAGTGDEWETVSVNADNQALYRVKIHLEYDPVFIGGEILYFDSWDSEEQIAWFGQREKTGYRITDRTDIVFRENIEEFIGKYTMVEISAREEDDFSELISVQLTDSRIDRINKIENGEVTIGEQVFALPEGWELPMAEVGEYALIHFLAGQLVGLETLCQESGILTYWDSEKEEMTIEPLDTSFEKRILKKSPFLAEQAGAVLGETGPTRSVIQYLKDSDNFWYYIEYMPVMWVKEPEDQYYTGKQLKPVVEVYDGNKLLTENVDYTLKFKNNTKANDASDPKTAPTITVSGKGNYSETEIVTFRILPQSIEADNVTIPDIILKYNGKVQKPLPTVTWNGKKLKNKADYIVEYPDIVEGAYQNSGEYTIVVKGQGNFTGEKRIVFKITEGKLLTKATISKIPSQLYSGNAIQPDFVIKDGGKVLNPDTDYTVFYKDNVEIGTAKIVITGQGEYSGIKEFSFTITGGSISKAKVQGLETSVVYDGEKVKQSVSLTVTVAGEARTLTEGTDYIVSWPEQKGAGKTKVVFTGINGYSGVLTKNFTITPYVISSEQDPDFKVECEEEVNYSKSGSKPDVRVTFKGKILEEGIDYKLSYKNCQSVNDGSNLKKQPTVIVTGKGNFKGTVKSIFRISAQNLDIMDVSVDDKVYQNKVNAWKSVMAVTDLEGKKLSAGKDYDKNLIYTYKNDTILENGTMRYAGEEVLKNDILQSGTVVCVTAVGKGNYTGQITGEYRITKKSISKAKVYGPTYEYTGTEIRPGEDMFYVLVEGTLLAPEDYEIIGYKNNVKTGNASVTIRGTGNYGGLKTAAFKIAARSIIAWWKSLFR